MPQGQQNRLHTGEHRKTSSPQGHRQRPHLKESTHSKGKKNSCLGASKIDLTKESTSQSQSKLGYQRTGGQIHTNPTNKPTQFSKKKNHKILKKPQKNPQNPQKYKKTHKILKKPQKKSSKPSKTQKNHKNHKILHAHPPLP